jgi:hypothetical protein
MKKIRIGAALLLTCLTLSLRAGDEFCDIRNHAFQDGEEVKFFVYYTLAGVFVYGGDASFNTTLERYNGKPVYHIVGSGSTNPFFDKFFKVRDTYETYIDTATLQPYKFIRNVFEGGYKKYENVSFNQKANTATSTKGTFKVPNCIQDVLSAIYYARNIEFNKYKPGDKINFDMYIDDEIFNMYIRYLGKEKIKTKYGKFNAIKFKPLLIKGTIFEGGEKMTVWVSDDPNHIPLRIESPISVGSVKVDMMGYKNLRYPLTSLINVR